MPTKEQLEKLEAAILRHVVPRPGRKQCVIKYVFEELRKNPARKAAIAAKDVLAHCKGKKAGKDNGAGALRRVKADLKKRLDDFFEGEGQTFAQRMTFQGGGSFLPVFLPNNAKEYAPLFWGPYLDCNRATRLMYPEPFFLTDKFSTTFRNSKVNRLEDKKELAYLDGPRRRKIKGAEESYVASLKAGYSYVPAGIVQAMFLITHCLLRHAKATFELEAEPMMPLDSRPRSSDELILFATPTSVTEIVRNLENGLRLQTSSEGVRIDGGSPISEPENGEEFVKWGVITRKRHQNRTITLISAKHGRAVEAIAEQLTISAELSLLAEKLQTPNGFPLEFQALYSVHMTRTPEGPRPDKTKLEKAFNITPRS